MNLVGRITFCLMNHWYRLCIAKKKYGRLLTRPSKGGRCKRGWVTRREESEDWHTKFSLIHIIGGQSHSSLSVWDLYKNYQYQFFLHVPWDLGRLFATFRSWFICSHYRMVYIDRWCINVRLEILQSKVRIPIYAHGNRLIALILLLPPIIGSYRWK